MGGAEGAAPTHRNGPPATDKKAMSVCLGKICHVICLPICLRGSLTETNTVLANEVGTPSQHQTTEETPVTNPQVEQTEVTQQSVRTITKPPAAPNAAKTSLITVLNTPIVNVKTLCVTPAVSSTTPAQFTVVNSGAQLNVANASLKPQTITLINTPVTVVKTISPNVEKSESVVVPNSSVTGTGVPTLIESRGHNVFVKNTSENIAPTQDVPQSHKLLTANNFPASNLITAPIDPQRTANGQRSGGKVKILSNVLMPGPSQTNLLLNKPTNIPQRYAPRQKIHPGANNGATTKYLNKPPTHLMNRIPPSSINVMNKQPPQRMMSYPTHKSHIKTLAPVNNYLQNKSGGPPGIKTLPPKGSIPGQVQRTGSGLRTIPPQRPQKMPNKPNYIGKHAVQAQKMKQPHKMKMKPQMPVYNSYHGAADKQLTFNQALTAEILETLSNSKGAGNSYHPKGYDMIPPRYENAYYPPSEAKSCL